MSHWLDRAKSEFGGRYAAGGRETQDEFLLYDGLRCFSHPFSTIFCGIGVIPWRWVVLFSHVFSSLGLAPRYVSSLHPDLLPGLIFGSAPFVHLHAVFSQLFHRGSERRKGGFAVGSNALLLSPSFRRTRRELTHWSLCVHIASHLGIWFATAPSF